MPLNENSPHDVASASGANAELLQRLAELEERLAQYENNVVQGPQGEAPLYNLNEPVYLEDHFLEAGREIEWWGEPNLSMVPKNEPAKRRMQEYLDWMADAQQEAAEAAGRKFTGLITDKGVMIATSMHDARKGNAPQLTMPEDKGVVPPMPNTEEALALAKRRGPGRPPKLGKVGAIPEIARGRPGDGRVGPGQEPAIFKAS